MEELTIIWDYLSNILIGGGILGSSSWVGRLLVNKMIRSYTIKGFWNYIKVWRGKKPQIHKIFESLSDKLYEIKNTELSTPLKTNLYQIILNNKINTVIEYLRIWSVKNQGKFKKINDKSLLKLMKDLIPLMIEGSYNNQVNGYETNIYQNLTKVYGEDKGRRYYDHVYTRKFKPEHNKNVEYINDFFDNFFIYENRDNYYLIDEFMDRINMALIISMSDMKNIISVMNGDLESI